MAHNKINANILNQATKQSNLKGTATTTITTAITTTIHVVKAITQQYVYDPNAS